MAHQFQTQSLEKALIFVIFLASRWELFLETGFETGTYAIITRYFKWCEFNATD